MKNLLYILLAFTLFSCSEDDLTPTDPVDLSGIDQSTELGRSIYSIYEQYGSVVKYQYDTIDYRSLITGYTSVTMIQQEDPEVIATSVDFAKEFFFDLFSEELLTQYAPRNVLLADTIKDDFNRDDKRPVAFARYNYIAITGFNSDWTGLSESQKEDRKKQIKIAFVRDFLIGENYMSVPDKFSRVSHEHYNSNSIWSGFMDYGFWQIGWWVPEDPAEDFANYIEKIGTTSHEDILEEIEGYPLMQQKYTEVLAWLEDNNINF